MSVNFNILLNIYLLTIQLKVLYKKALIFLSFFPVFVDIVYGCMLKLFSNLSFLLQNINKAILRKNRDRL